MVKCLVWDLDDTLWQGTLLEGDPVAVTGPVQEAIRTLDSRGILQSVASRNDPEQAMAALERLGWADYLVVPEIGWGPKSAAVRRIAERLGFAHTAMAFIDDNPAERAEVRFHLPQVRCYPAGSAGALGDLAEFAPTTVTSDARHRRQFYQAQFRRTDEQAAFAGPDAEFVRSLRVVLRIECARAADLDRVEELTRRTSQMNATGVHHPRADLLGWVADDAHEVLVVSMADRLGSYGTVGIILLALHADVWHVKLLATSCRVVSLGVGSVLLDWFSDAAAEAGVHLLADFRPTERNRMMEIAYRFAGLDDGPCACRAQVGPAPDASVQRLHLAPVRHPAPANMTVEGLRLGTGPHLRTGSGCAHG